MAWENMTDIFTPEGLQKIKVGQVMMFNLDGVRNEYRIMRIKNGKVWGKKVITYHPSQVEITEGETTYLLNDV